MAAQLRRLYEEKCLDKKPVCHAVSVGSTFESGVLKAIAACGGGSTRQISGEQGPRPVALDLLKEITRPALRDLKVQFSGLRMARVYPEQLPNLPGGSQQILLGRYLPQGVVGAGVPPAESAAETAAPQSGKVIVTGRQGDREVRFEKAVSLADAEHGNSFIPRLWARMHLDYLLQQGATPAIQDDIIALSEDYHIITPYTSLLILESDADRERFKVKRGFTMRDGEKFFAAGRDNANFELTRQQMRRAGGWRLGLRMSVLQQFAGLGRDSGAFQPRVAPTNMFFLLNENEMGGIGGGSRDRPLSLDGENSYTGGTSVVAGTLNLSYDSSWSADVNGAIDSLGNFADKERFVGAGDDESLAERDSRESRGFVVQDQATAVSLPVSGKNKALLLPAAALPMSELRIGGGLIGFAGALRPIGNRHILDSYIENRPTYSWANGEVNYSWANGEVDNWLNGLFGVLPPAPAGKKPPAAKPEWPEEVLTISRTCCGQSSWPSRTASCASTCTPTTSIPVVRASRRPILQPGRLHHNRLSRNPIPASSPAPGLGSSARRPTADRPRSNGVTAGHPLAGRGRFSTARSSSAACGKQSKRN